MSRIKIIRAKASDCRALTLLARSAKAHWGYPHEWIQEWYRTLTITSTTLRGSEAFVAWSGQKRAGFYVLCIDEGWGRLEHLWIQPGHIGRGIGRRLFAHALGRARHNGLAWVEIESDPNAAGFYRRMGGVERGCLPSRVNGFLRWLPVLVYWVRRAY